MQTDGVLCVRSQGKETAVKWDRMVMVDNGLWVIAVRGVTAVRATCHV